MFRTALTELAQLQVNGVAANYDVDAVPDELHRGQLPALLVLPIEMNLGQSRRPFQEHGQGFEALGFSNDGVRTVTYTVTHLLLVAPVAAGSGLRTHLPVLVDLIDNYFSALAAAVTLNGKLLEPARVTIDPGEFRYSGVDYHACAFRHTWIIQL